MGKQKMTPIGIACILLVLLVVAFMVRRSLREPEKIVLPPERIAAADYRALKGVNCIYVETEPDEAGYVERYWVSVSSGLLAAAERECDGAVVYRMAALTVSYDGVDAEDFTLPNGTVLYEPAVAATKEISEND